MKITIKEGYVDRLRKYKVIVDNNYLGDINAGETKKHTIHLDIK